MFFFKLDKKHFPVFLGVEVVVEKHIDFMEERCERFVVMCAIELFYFIFHLRDKLVALDDERSLRKQFGILLLDLVLQLLVHPA